MNGGEDSQGTCLAARREEQLGKSDHVALPCALALSAVAALDFDGAVAPVVRIMAPNVGAGIAVGSAAVQAAAGAAGVMSSSGGSCGWAVGGAPVTIVRGGGACAEGAALDCGARLGQYDPLRLQVFLVCPDIHGDRSDELARLANHHGGTAAPRLT